MGELKPIGSEKLSGDDKLKRILELTYYKAPASSAKKAETIKETVNGVYGIVKEKDGYYVKKGINESSLDYIGGLFMKNKNRFLSYNEAFKRMDFLVGLEEKQNLQEATKYVLKTGKPSAPKTQEEAPAPMPSIDPPAAPQSAEPTAPESPVPPTDSMPPAPEGGEEEKGGESDFVKVIQRLTGRLKQKLDSHKEHLEKDDIKYVLNMILPSIDFSKLDEADQEEILSKLEGDEEEGDDTGLDTPPADDADPTAEPAPAPVPADKENEMGEMDGIDQLEELLKPFDDEFGDDDDYVPLTPEDVKLMDVRKNKASKFAQKDIENDTIGLDDLEDIEEPTDDLGAFDPESEDDEELDEFTITPEETSDDVREIDLNELTDAVQKGVKETLSKYFQ